MKVLFLTDNFPPEVNAPATRSFEHCRKWVSMGADVTVVTCAPNFPAGRLFEGYRNRLHQRETMDGIDVVRVWTYIAPNAGFVRRILDYVSFAASSFWAGLFIDADVIVATSPQFFTTFSGAALSRLKRRPWVFELRDLWPESIVATGAMRRGRAIDFLERLELALYADADLVVAVTDAFRRDLTERGVDQNKIVVVPNGVHAEQFRSPGPARENGSRFTVGYVGTMGLAHGLEVMLEAATLLADEPYEFILVGDGARRDHLEEASRQRALSNVSFRSPVPREAVPRLLGELDVAVVPLRNSPTFKTVIPSKIFEAAAAERPILLGVDGEARRIVEAHDAGIAFEPENGVALADALRRLAGDPDLYRRIQAGCRSLAEAYDRDRLAITMLEHLQALRPDGSPLIQPPHARERSG